MRIAALLLLLTACPRPAPPGPPPGRATCYTMCARAAELDCEFAKPTPNGAACVQVCDNTVESGLIRWNLDCRAGALSCDAMEACE
jgi:hypothetical protein